MTVLKSAVNAGAVLTIEIVDVYGMGSAMWAPTIDSLYHIGLDAQGHSLVAADTWVAFNGRLGFNYQGKAAGCQSLQCIGECGPYYTAANAGFQSFACSVVPTAMQTSNGPGAFGNKDTTKPTIADTDPGLPAPGSQLIYPLPVESGAGLLVSWTNGHALQGDVYHPLAMAQGGSAWHGVFNQLCAKDSGCSYGSGQGRYGNDVSIVYFNAMYVSAYTDRLSNVVGYATSTNPLNGWMDHGWIDTAHFSSFTLPAMAVYNGSIVMVGSY